MDEISDFDSNVLVRRHKSKGWIILSVVVIISVLIGMFYFAFSKTVFDNALDSRSNTIDSSYKEDYAIELAECEDYAEKAVEQGEISEEYAVWVTDTRYSELAESTGEAGICNEISNGNSRNYCLAYFSFDASYCENINEENFKSSCYFEVAIRSNNSELCENIIEERSSGEEKDRCYMDIGGKMGDLSICDMISDETTFRESCYIDVAVKNKDRTICASLSERKHDACYADLVRVLPDITLCEEIVSKTTSNFNNCYRWIAGQTGDASVCEFVTSFGNDKENCLRAAENFKNGIFE